MKRLVLNAVASALDGLEIAFCAFDGQDRALAWNTTFLEFFPEHRGQVHVGEPYADNLRRFYLHRLDAAELPMLQRYIDEGIARHRTQRRPYEFDHRGFRVKVSSVEMGAFGRVRVWRRRDTAASEGAASPSPAHSIATLPIEHLVDGVLLVDSGDRITAANQPFLSLYRIECVADIKGQSFEAVYRRAWADQRPGTDYRRSLDALKDHQRFSGAPYEVAMPGGRWVRVVEHRASAANGGGCFVHVDITNLKRQEHALRQAEAAARRHQALYRLLCESSLDVTLAVSDGQIIYASPSVTRVLGWQAEELVGRTAMSVIQACDGASTSARLSDYRVQARRADGSRLLMDARARPTQPLDESAGRETIVITLQCPPLQVPGIAEPEGGDSIVVTRGTTSPGLSRSDSHWAT